MDSREQIDAAFAAHKREQAKRALAMTMGERLEWLERTLAGLDELHGAALRAQAVSPGRDRGLGQGPQARHRYSYADYIELERERGVRLEYLDGDIFAIPPASPDHAALAVNLAFALLGERERGGRVYGPDMRIRVLATGFATHPDLAVIRGPFERDPDSRTTIVNPRVLAEILSDATEIFDREVKLADYQRIPSLRACLLVGHRRPRIELWRREGDGWTRTVHAAGEELELRAIGVRFAVDAIYRGVLGGGSIER